MFANGIILYLLLCQPNLTNLMETCIVLVLISSTEYWHLKICSRHLNEIFTVEIICQIVNCVCHFFQFALWVIYIHCAILSLYNQVWSICTLHFCIKGVLLRHFNDIHIRCSYVNFVKKLYSFICSLFISL